MNGHPGGEEQTDRLLELAKLPAGARVLDLGAGAGETLSLLRALGFPAEGIDLEPRADAVRCGDLLRAPYPDESFDAVLSQCAFFVSGDQRGALREAYRLLRPGGRLLLSDLEFEPLRALAEEAGFRVEAEEDRTEEWREHYFAALWRGETCRIPLKRGKCGYKLLIGRKD